MTELIKIEKQGEIETVNARELHEFLESKQKYVDWIKNRIDKYSFSEGSDFIIILGKSTGGRPSTEYFISIDMAKELSMVENNNKGKEARAYFIARDKLVNQLSIPKTFAAALRLAADQQEEIDSLKPRALLADKAIRDGSKQYSITDAGKHLRIRQSDMFSMLRSDNMLTKKNLPTQRALDKGILSVRTNVTENGNRPQAVMTMENIYFFAKRYDFNCAILSEKETLKPLFEIKKLEGGE